LAFEVSFAVRRSPSSFAVADFSFFHSFAVFFSTSFHRRRRMMRRGRKTANE